MLVLARHGQSEANVAGLLVGRADSPLTDLGRRQADAIAAAIAEEAASAGRPIARLITSPLGRAVATAERIAAALPGGEESGSLPIEIDDRLVELDYGELDLHPLGGVDPAIWSAWRSDSSYRPPRGETLEELASRIDPVLAELLPVYAARSTRQDAVIVSHVSPIKAMIASVLGAGVEVSWRMSLSVASLSRITSGGGGEPVLLTFNENGHLSGL
jgi:broad specificity phosphatase PhoE